MSRASLDKRPRDVAAMFDSLAGRYDLMNALMTFGQERWWRRVVAADLAAGPGDRVLDLAAGTGTSAAAFAAHGATVVACDFSFGMLQEGRHRHPGLAFLAGDALALPFADGAFDAVTTSFGLRNFADLDAAVAELLRVTRPGGRLVVLETSTPAGRLVRAGHRAYLRHGLPVVARLASHNAGAYGYLAESTIAWPDPPGLAARLVRAGWAGVDWRPLSLGTVAVHRARRPAPRPGPAPLRGP